MMIIVPMIRVVLLVTEEGFPEGITLTKDILECREGVVLKKRCVRLLDPG